MSNPSDEDSNEQRYQQRMIERGFDPDEQIYEFYGCFTLAEAKESLFGSTGMTHKPVHLTDEEEGIRVPVVIDLASPRFTNGLANGKMPDWYFEGWILDPRTPGVERVRIHVSTMDYDTELHDDDIFNWQKIKEPTSFALPIDASIKKLLGVTGRIGTLFYGPGIETIGDLLEFAKRHDFSEISGFGPGLLANLKEKLTEAGYDVEDFKFNGR